MVHKVDVLLVGEHSCVDSALVRWPVKAEPPSISTIMVKVGVGACLAHEGVTEPCVVCQWRRSLAVAGVPKEHNIAPAGRGGVHACGDVLADGLDGDLVPVHVGNGHRVGPAHGLVEDVVLRERRVWTEEDVAFTPQRLIGLEFLGHTGPRESWWARGPVRQTRLGDTAWPWGQVESALIAGLAWVRLPGAWRRPGGLHESVWRGRVAVLTF